MADEPTAKPPEGRRSPPAGGRRFSDEEVRRVLRLASRAEERTGLPAPHDPTLTDLEEAAEAVGIDPAAVRRAAAVAPWPSGGVSSLLFGAPDRRELRAFLPGLALPEVREPFVRAAQRTLGRPGEVAESDRGRFVWREDHRIGRTAVTLEDTGEGTEVRVAADRAGHYFLGWFGALAAWGGGLALLSPFPTASGLTLYALGMLFGPFLLARPFWRAADRKLRARLEDATLEIVRAVEEGAGAG